MTNKPDDNIWTTVHLNGYQPNHAMNSNDNDITYVSGMTIRHPSVSSSSSSSSSSRHSRYNNDNDNNNYANHDDNRRLHNLKSQVHCHQLNSTDGKNGGGPTYVNITETGNGSRSSSDRDSSHKSSSQFPLITNLVLPGNTPRQRSDSLTSLISRRTSTPTTTSDNQRQSHLNISHRTHSLPLNCDHANQSSNNPNRGSNLYKLCLSRSSALGSSSSSIDTFGSNSDSSDVCSSSFVPCSCGHSQYPKNSKFVPSFH